MLGCSSFKDAMKQNCLCGSEKERFLDAVWFKGTMFE
jgi:hypothetical protein